MKKLLFLAVSFFVSNSVLAQEKLDSIRQLGEGKLKGATAKIDSVNQAINSNLANIGTPVDSTSKAAIHKADSIRTSFQSKADSLQLAYQKPINKLDSVSRGIQHKMDSLQALGRAGRKLLSKYKTKMDSVTRAKTQKIAELNRKVNHLKSRATAGLKEINLPPQLQGPVKNLEQSIQGYKIPMVNGKIPNLNLSTGSVPGVQLPGKLNLNSPGNVQLPGVNTGINSSLNGITNETKELSAVTKQVSGYGNDVQNIAKGDINQVKNLDKTAENEVLKTQGLKELKGNSAELTKYQKQLNGRPDSAAVNVLKQEGMKELTKEATNHFAGQEAMLKETMGMMGKLKAKYANVKSVAELPKKLPNPLHDTPLIERIIPGLTFQIYNSSNVLLDINPLALYRISPRLSSGPGWVERVTFGHNKGQHGTHVYGPRGVFQFEWGKGFNLRFLPEVLNTFVPPQFIQTKTAGDPGERQWIFGAFVGLKKEFVVYKKIKGNTEAMYNLANTGFKSPYQDRLVVRFGFEFPFKKKR